MYTLTKLKKTKQKKQNGALHRHLSDLIFTCVISA